MLKRCMLVVGCVMLLVACGDDDAPGGSGGTGGSGGSGGTGGSSHGDCVVVTTPTGAATFDAIFDEVLCANGCTGSFCHGGSATGGLRLDQREAAYSALVGAQAAGEECAPSGLTLVVPGSADDSLLIRKLMPDPPCGTAMPLYAELENTYIPDAQIDQLRAWINAGALRHPPAEMDAGNLDSGDDDAGN